MNESIRYLIQMGECSVDNMLAFAMVYRELNSKDPFMNKEKMGKIFKKTFKERPFTFILRGVEWEIIKEWINTLNEDLIFEKFFYVNRIYIHELIEFWEEL